MDVNEKKQASAHRDLPGRGSLRARTAGKLVGPEQDSISAPWEIFAAQRNTGPARRGAGGLHKASNTGTLKRRRAHEQG